LAYEQDDCEKEGQIVDFGPPLPFFVNSLASVLSRDYTIAGDSRQEGVSARKEIMGYAAEGKIK
jgi:hypothetical protein